MNETMPVGKPRQETQAKELEFWSGHGLNQWDLHLRDYKKIFPFETVGYRTTKVLDVGSGPISVFEKFAPEEAPIYPYDTLADDYNRIAPKKKFRVHQQIPSITFQLITLFNCLDHMDDPNELLSDLTQSLDKGGEVWIYCHLDRPFSPEEHPQKFRFWQIITLVNRHYEIKRCGIIREGRLFPYAWWAICGPKRYEVNDFLPAVFILRCGMTYGRFHTERAAIKLVKMVGLRRLLPAELQF